RTSGESLRALLGRQKTDRKSARLCISLSLESRGRRFDGGLVVIGALHLDPASVHLVAARGINRIKILPAKRQVGNLAIGRRYDAVHSPCLVADLQPQPRGDVQPPVA